MFQVQSYIGKNCIYQNFEEFVKKIMATNQNFLNKFSDAQSYYSANDKKWAKVFEKIAHMELEHLDAKKELTNKLDEKSNFLLELLKVMKTDVISYTDARLE